MENEAKKLDQKTYFSVLAPRWKELISFLIKRREDNYIQIVEAQFYKLIMSVMSDTLNLDSKFEDNEIQFSLKIKFDNLGTVLKYMGKSTLYNKMFDAGQILEDGSIAKASESSWDQGTGELVTKMAGEKDLRINVKLNFVENTVDATINWATIKQILPHVDKEMGLILAMTTLNGINSGNK